MDLVDQLDNVKELTKDMIDNSYLKRDYYLQNTIYEHAKNSADDNSRIELYIVNSYDEIENYVVQVHGWKDEIAVNCAFNYTRVPSDNFIRDYIRPIEDKLRDYFRLQGYKVH